MLTIFANDGSHPCLEPTILDVFTPFGLQPCFEATCLTWFAIVVLSNYFWRVHKTVVWHLALNHFCFEISIPCTRFGTKHEQSATDCWTTPKSLEINKNNTVLGSPHKSKDESGNDKNESGNLKMQTLIKSRFCGQLEFCPSPESGNVEPNIRECFRPVNKKDKKNKTSRNNQSGNKGGVTSGNKGATFDIKPRLCKEYVLSRPQSGNSEPNIWECSYVVWKPQTSTAIK